MKAHITKRRSLPLAVVSALSLAVPVSMLLPGCGGGSSLSSQTYTSALTLSPTQNGVLNLTVSGGSANGTLIVSGASNVRQTRDLSFAIPNNSYVVTGTFSPPSFSVSGTIPGVGPFTIEGEVPANGGDGTYTLTVNGETVTGTFTPTTIPTNTGSPTTTPQSTATTSPTTTGTPSATRTGTPGPTATSTPRPTSTSTPRPTATTRPTATPRPTATTRPTPIPTNNGCSNEDANLVFSAFSASYNGSRVNTTCGSGFAATGPGGPNAINPVISLFEGINATVKERRLNIFIDSSTPITPGTQYQLSAASPQKIVSYAEFRGTSNVALAWNYTRTGTITIQSIDDDSVTVVLSGVGFGAQSGGAQGSFVLNGTYTVPRQ